MANPIEDTYAMMQIEVTYTVTEKYGMEIETRNGLLADSPSRLAQRVQERLPNAAQVHHLSMTLEEPEQILRALIE